MKWLVELVQDRDWPDFLLYGWFGRKIRIGWSTNHIFEIQFSLHSACQCKQNHMKCLYLIYKDKNKK